MTLTKKSLTIKLLAFLIVFASLSLSQTDGIERKRPQNILDNKPASMKQTIRYGERGGDAQGKVHQKNFTPFLPMKVSADVSLGKTKILSPTPMNKEADNNTGRAIVCGPKDAKFNITWKPKIIDPEKFVQLYLDITPLIDFNEGKAHVDVYLEGSPDRLFSMDQEIACDDFVKMIPFVKLLCPLKKGARYRMPWQFNQLQVLPVGSYTIVLNVYSYLPKPQELFVCLNITVQVMPSTYMFFNSAP